MGGRATDGPYEPEDPAAYGRAPDHGGERPYHPAAQSQYFQPEPYGDYDFESTDYEAFDPEEDEGFITRHTTAIAIGLGVAALALTATVAFFAFSGVGAPTANTSPSPTTGPSASVEPLGSAAVSPPPGPTANPSLAPASCLPPGSASLALGATPPSRAMPASGNRERDEGVPLLSADADGCAHIVVRIDEGRAVYLTDRTGGWSERALPAVKEGCRGEDVASALSIDQDRSAWVLLTRVCAGRRAGSEGTFVTTNRTGSWSEPTRLTEAGTVGLAMAVREGRIHMAYRSGSELHYRTDAGGAWTDELVHRRGAAEADLVMGRDGRPRILFIGNAIRYAVAATPTGDFEVEKIADFHEAWSPRLALDGSDRPHALWGEDWPRSTGISSGYARRERSWRGLGDIFGRDAEALGLAVDREGVVHGLAGDEEGGLTHATDLAGDFEWQLLFPSWHAWYSPGEVVMDQLGRLHVAFYGQHPQLGSGLWHSAGVPLLGRLENPISVWLEVTQDAQVDERGWASVTGTLSCSRPASGVLLSVSVEQDRPEGYEDGYGEASLACAVQPTAWRIDAGHTFGSTNFGPGTAAAVVGANLCESLFDIHFCHWVEARESISLVGPPGLVTPSATPSLTPSPPPATPTTLVKPILNFTGRRAEETTEGTVIFFDLAVANWRDFPAELFAASPELPPCGSNTQASRTWVEIRDASNDNRLNSNCALYDPAGLADDLWFALNPDDPVPFQVYLQLTDRLTGRVINSDPLLIPPEPQ